MPCPALKLSLSVGWMMVESGSGNIELIWDRTEDWILSIGCPCAEDPWPACWKWGLLWRLGVCGEGLGKFKLLWDLAMWQEVADWLDNTATLGWRILGRSECWVLVLRVGPGLTLIDSYPSLSSPSGPALQLLLPGFLAFLLVKWYPIIYPSHKKFNNAHFVAFCKKKSVLMCMCAWENLPTDISENHDRKNSTDLDNQ